MRLEISEDGNLDRVYERLEENMIKSILPDEMLGYQKSQSHLDIMDYSAIDPRCNSREPAPPPTRLQQGFRAEV